MRLRVGVLDYGLYFCVYVVVVLGVELPVHAGYGH